MQIRQRQRQKNFQEKYTGKRLPPPSPEEQLLWDIRMQKQLLLPTPTRKRKRGDGLRLEPRVNTEPTSPRGDRVRIPNPTVTPSSHKYPREPANRAAPTPILPLKRGGDPIVTPLHLRLGRPRRSHSMVGGRGGDPRPGMSNVLSYVDTDDPSDTTDQSPPAYWGPERERGALSRIQGSPRPEQGRNGE
jgi:hypothetical protein